MATHTGAADRKRLTKRLINNMLHLYIMVGEAKINITFETLFEILRNEKNRSDLQKLSPTFSEDVSSYLQDKQSMLRSTPSKLDVFSEEEKEKTVMQLSKIKSILKELYERRERKVADMALNKARTNTSIIDTSALMAREKELFESLVDILGRHKQAAFSELFEQKTVVVRHESQESPLKEEEEEGEEKQEEKQADMKMVRFLYAVPKFMGKELETYGPFDEEDVASLPAEIAELLVKKGRAEELSND